VWSRPAWAPAPPGRSGHCRSNGWRESAHGHASE
jgi:hypothetical protein